MRYMLKKGPDGKWQAAMLLPAGDGTFSSVAQGFTAAEATVKAARGAYAAATPQAPRAAAKAKIVEAMGALAKNATIRDALLSGGIEAAKTAALALPGGAVALKALEVAKKFGPAKKLLGRLLKV